MASKVSNKKVEQTENNLSDEEVMTILKKDMFKYATMMTNAKNNFKKIAIEKDGDKKITQNKLDYLITEYNQLKNNYKELEKRYNQLEERTKKQKQTINDTSELGFIDIEDEIKQYEKESEKIYKERKDKDLEEFKKMMGC
jgi:archaellum component FlaC